MQATLIHNPNAGGINALSSESIIELLGEISVTATCPPTTNETDLSAALQNPGELVIAAGGDGTVRAVALELHKLGLQVPLAILPLGTANNIARTLSLTEPPQALLKGLARPRVRRFDVGCARGPWGEVRFLEAFGFGLLAHGLTDYNPGAGKSLVRAIGVALSTLTSYEAKPWRLTLDGEDLSGRFLLLEVMNTSSVGLRMVLAPDADPSDGLFDLVLVKDDDRVGLRAYLANLVAGKLESLPNVTLRRGKRLEISWDGSPLHYDEEVLVGERLGGERLGGEVPISTAPNNRLGSAEVTLEAGALELWLPTLSS